MGLANAAGLAKADDLTDDNDPTNAAFRQYSKYSTLRRRFRRSRWSLWCFDRFALVVSAASTRCNAGSKSWL